MNKSTLLALLLLWIDINSLSMAKGSLQQSKQHVKPAIQHGVTYKTVSDISQYYVSEKLDGIRGYWNGKQLITRQGNLINSPSWFTLHWPTYPMDGELWIKRDTFQPLLSCVSKNKAEENKKTSCWKNVRFMMFDLPTHSGKFSLRVKKMRTLLTKVTSPYLAMINQIKFNNMNELDLFFNDIVVAKGEGLMLHFAGAFYKNGRNSALMKLKKNQDAEATVIAHTQGKGKYQGQLGAIQVKTAKGIIFKIGTGFSDKQRANPPQIGTIITFKYNGLTQAGVPRFARFWRIKSAK